MVVSKLPGTETSGRSIYDFEPELRQEFEGRGWVTTALPRIDMVCADCAVKLGTANASPKSQEPTPEAK
jgi:hypothetical protein